MRFSTFTEETLDKKTSFFVQCVFKYVITWFLEMIASLFFWKIFYGSFCEFIDYGAAYPKEIKKNKEPIDLCLTRRKIMWKNNIVQSLRE